MADSAAETLARGDKLEGAPTAESLADELVSTREKIKEGAKPKVFELPNYGRKLMVKYKVVDYDEVTEVGERVAAQVRNDEIDDAMYAGLVDTLISACVGFYRGNQDGEEVSLEEAAGLEGGAIRWGDDRLASLLRIQSPAGEKLTARQVLLQVFGDNKLLVIDHAQEVTRWMERARRNVANDF